MISFNDCDPRSLDLVDQVVEALESRTGLDPDTLMLVGAGCRDIIHSALGHQFPLRGTTDTDLGIALTNWDIYQDIVREFKHVGSNGVRFEIARALVDIVPFGGIENPDGIATPSPRRESMVVFGFDDVYTSAAALSLPHGSAIRVPTPAGYAALKMRAWIDRSAHGEDKDAKDLAAAVFWYQNSNDVRERVWDTSEGEEILEAVNWDLDLAAVRILRNDIAAVLSELNLTDLRRRWNSMDQELLADSFQLPTQAQWSADRPRRLAFIRELSPTR